VGLCTVGAFVLYLLNRNGGREPFSLFKGLNLDVSRETGRPHMILLDMVISSLLGGAVVYALVQPASMAQAIVAGLGMTGLLQATVKES
jgi:hypothetical protein